MAEPLVTRDPEVCGGAPVLRGTRLFVTFVSERLAGGAHPNYTAVRQNWSTIEDWSNDDLRRAASYPRQLYRWNDDDYDLRPDDTRHDRFSLCDEMGCLDIDGDRLPDLVAALSEAYLAHRNWKALVEDWETHQDGLR